VDVPLVEKNVVELIVQLNVIIIGWLEEDIKKINKRWR